MQLMTFSGAGRLPSDGGACGEETTVLECASFVSEPQGGDHVVHQLLGNEGILLIHPDGPIAMGDFEAVARSVDPYIEHTGTLRGVVAAVSDSAILSIAPQIAKHFVHAEIRHFSAGDRDVALAWLRDDSKGRGTHGSSINESLHQAVGDRHV